MRKSPLREEVQRASISERRGRRCAVLVAGTHLGGGDGRRAQPSDSPAMLQCTIAHAARAKLSCPSPRPVVTATPTAAADGSP